MCEIKHTVKHGLDWTGLDWTELDLQNADWTCKTPSRKFVKLELKKRQRLCHFYQIILYVRSI